MPTGAEIVLAVGGPFLLGGVAATIDIRWHRRRGARRRASELHERHAIPAAEWPLTEALRPGDSVNTGSTTTTIEAVTWNPEPPEPPRFAGPIQAWSAEPIVIEGVATPEEIEVIAETPPPAGTDLVAMIAAADHLAMAMRRSANHAAARRRRPTPTPTVGPSAARAARAYLAGHR